MLLEGLASLGIEVTSPETPDTPRLRERLSRIHTRRYLDFLETIYSRWSALPESTAVVSPNVHPCGGGHHYPRHPVGKAAWHMHGMSCCLTAYRFSGGMAGLAGAEAVAAGVGAAD